jgi:hypothetical protein
MKSLSRADFPKSALKFDRTGLVTPRASKRG